MTREEAIELIDDRMCFGRGKWSKHHEPEIDEYWQAGQMAIKALKSKIDLDLPISPLLKESKAHSATDTDVSSRKGVFIPGITVEMFRNASLKGVEELMASGEMEDISLPTAQPELIEKAAYTRGFEQGRTQGMIDSQGGKK